MTTTPTAELDSTAAAALITTDILAILEACTAEGFAIEDVSYEADSETGTLHARIHSADGAPRFAVVLGIVALPDPS
ncbi:hypothetical protein BKA24_001747 [Microbacterium marinum]|uniref:Uncharacterized protein n=1 Tax=Microbacterium marinum TaxID=421115 RepID=A0A7W7BST7_9MICO|nr:hypothetical protein [Microbacterium marinum]MBB4667038.1 hypothetical protein [Microbacterium marinum]